MFNIFEEISWPQFVRMSHISPLPLHEQTNQYNQYLYQLSEARSNWVSTQSKGPRGIVTVGNLAQEEYDPISEDYFLVLQENGSSIEVTKYID